MSTTTCSKCGGIVRVDRGVCPSCGATRMATTVVPAPVPSAPAPAPRREDVGTRIRARVMWGDKPAEIRNELLKDGARPGDVDALMRKALEQRKAYYRTLGLKNVIGGAALLALGSGIILCVLAFFSGGVQRIPVWFLIGGVTVPAAGILLLLKGVRRMSKPGEGETTAHADLEDEED